MNAKKNPSLTLAQYLETKEPAMVKVAQGVRRLVKATAPGTRECMNSWNIPTFEKSDGSFAIFMVSKAHVSLGFARATDLPDPHGLLEGTGKNMRHVKLKSVADLQREGVRELIEQAAKLPGRKMGKSAK